MLTPVTALVNASEVFVCHHYLTTYDQAAVPTLCACRIDLTGHLSVLHGPHSLAGNLFSTFPRLTQYYLSSTPSSSVLLAPGVFRLCPALAQSP